MDSHLFLLVNFTSRFFIHEALLLFHRLLKAVENNLHTIHLILHGGKYSQCLLTIFCNFSQILFGLNLCCDLTQHLHIHFFIFFRIFCCLTLLVTEKVEVHVDVFTGLPDHLLLSESVKELRLSKE